MSDTLHGGREVDVVILAEKQGEPSKKETFFVRQFRVREYRALFPISDDEIQLVAKACDKTVAIVGNVEPKSYEHLLKAMQEVNKDGFFTYRQRQLERANESLRDLPADALERIVKLNLPPASPASPPRPA